MHMQVGTMNFHYIHRSTTLHVSCTPIESRKSNHDYVNNFHSNSTAFTPVPSSDPSDPQHITYITRKSDAEAEYTGLIMLAKLNKL